MSTTRRMLGTGPMSTRATEAEERAPRLLPVERADHDDDQEHDHAPAAEPGSRRRELGGRGRGQIKEIPAPYSSST
ncbi:hypothetical protein ACGFNQ_37750 [Streptomyces asoensis]|uniref:hypothetical protein n=1 Tax=Streptomyces asoensis TaxID=249586 RepID=UPI0037245C5D